MTDDTGYYRLTDKAREQLRAWEDKMAAGGVTDEEFIAEVAAALEVPEDEAVGHLATLVAINELGGEATVAEVTAYLTGVKHTADALGA